MTLEVIMEMNVDSVRGVIIDVGRGVSKKSGRNYFVAQFVSQRGNSLATLKFFAPPEKVSEYADYEVGMCVEADTSAAEKGFSRFTDVIALRALKNAKASLTITK
jgi:hypothetical protein